MTSDTIASDMEERWRAWQALAVLDTSQLNGSTNGDPEFAQKLLDLFFESSSKYLADLNQAVHGDRLSDISQIGHAAKGSSQAIGATRLAALFLALEQDQDMVASELIAPILKDEIAKVRNEVVKLGLWREAA